MRLLFVHSDHLEFEANVEAGAGIAETEGVSMEGRMEDCVTAFVTVESVDEADLDAVVADAADELRDVADRLNTRKVVLSPDAHLSEDLADPDSAKAALRDLQSALETDDYDVLRAPFGWHTALEVSCKGHPLSEHSHRVVPSRGTEAGAPGNEAERTPSEWRLVFPDGETCDAVEARADDRVSDDLRALVAAEVEGETVSESGRPSRTELLQEQGLVGTDELGNPGGLFWYPRGKLIRDSLLEYADDLVVEYGGIPVETPYSDDVGGGTATGHLSVVRDANLVESDLPLRTYETARRSVRSEGKVGRNEKATRTEGDTLDLLGKRSLTVPEVLTATSDVEQAKDELAAQTRLARRASEDLGLNYVPTIRVTRAFYGDHDAWVQSLAEDLGEPTLVEVLPERHGYWSVSVDFAAIDGFGQPVEYATVELDAESAARFDVTYDASGETRNPVVLHCSPTGGVERVLAALLEQAAGQEVPRLPTWLSPTQVRFVPVGEEHVGYCEALADHLDSEGVRADVDDRDESVGQRLAAAESDWIPYFAVVGDREVEGERGTDRDVESDGDLLKVTVRAEETEREMTFEDLLATVLADVGDCPKRRRYLPKRVSRHPDFSGR